MIQSASLWLSSFPTIASLKMDWCGAESNASLSQVEWYFFYHYFLSLTTDAIAEAHRQLLTGHDGIYKTKERLMQCFYWPGMDADIAAHLKSCHQCQLRRRDDRPPPALLSPLPLPTEPGQRVHADLFGPLKTWTKVKSSSCASPMLLPNMSNWLHCQTKKLPQWLKPYSTNGFVALALLSIW